MADNNQEEPLENSLSHFSTSAPTTLPTDRQHVVDQMRKDKISVPQVSTYLRRWAIQEPDVQRVTLGNEG